MKITYLQFKHCRIIKKPHILIVLCAILLIGNYDYLHSRNTHKVITKNNPINISVNTSRENGVAPLSVFFDATGTTGLTDTGFFSNNAAYMDATFSWNFDADNIDPNGKYKKASGFLVSHVFEKTGLYRVHLDVYDAIGKTASYDIKITVTDFKGTTYYVANNGSDSNSGLSVTDPFLTPKYALTGKHVKPDTRILFKNGDTFTISNQITISKKTGPIIIGAYNDPNNTSQKKPVIKTTAVNSDWATIHLLKCNDIRLMDIAVRATAESSKNPRYPFGISWGYNCTNMLKYRTEEYQNGGMALSPCGQYNTIAECEFHNTTQTGYTSSGEGTNDGNAIIGNMVYDKNTVDTNNEEHIFRLQGGSRYFIANNIFGPNIKVNYDALTIRGNSEKVVIYKNKIEGWVQSIWPQVRNSYKEYQHHCMMDSNLIIGQGIYENDRGNAIAIRAKDIVIRNNIIINYKYGIGIAYDKVVGPSQRIKVYNNTFINNSANDTFKILYLGGTCDDIYIKNNLMLDIAGSNPKHTSFLELRNNMPLNGKSDNNVFYGNKWKANPKLFDGSTLANWQSSTSNDKKSHIANPILFTTNYNNADFCKPKSVSPLIDTGEFSPAALDYYGNIRDNFRDIGACEYIGIKKK